MGYTWAAGPAMSLLSYSAPAGDGEERIYCGYLRRETKLSRIVKGVRGSSATRLKDGSPPSRLMPRPKTVTGSVGTPAD
ncbi:hypothetical protein I552_2322 [Mycobacterium xenopi 3993]|nr:hypothetical protein I552_2322 [Mycobacterium xenopi 3993]